ncbi:hypothetical protein Droror1_Dr00010026 [Drosera rotundifolia]
MSHTHSISIDQYPSSLEAEIELEDTQPTHLPPPARVNMDSDAERGIASSDHLNDDPHISANADAVVESDVDKEPREEDDDVDAVFGLNQDSHCGVEDAEFDAVFDLNQDSHGGAEDAEFDLDDDEDIFQDDDEDIFQDDDDDDVFYDAFQDDDVFDRLTGTRRRRQVYGKALDGERRFRDVYGDELDGGMGRARGIVVEC